jgi:hypothetical protein
MKITKVGILNVRLPDNSFRVPEPSGKSTLTVLSMTRDNAAFTGVANP